MRLLDVPLINHESAEIFSIDLHPSGDKLATGGQSATGAGLLAVWDISFINSTGGIEKCEQEEYGVLAVIPQDKSLNCVRWTRLDGGRRFVCAGDEAILFVYMFASAGTEGVGSIHRAALMKTLKGGKSGRVENYRCVQQLRGHQLDVTHVDWSPNDELIASSSLDHTVMVWNVLSGERVATLKSSNGGHERGVKGLAWDPVGRFLATQGEDNTLRVWRVDTWECVRVVSEPLQESTSSALFTRMDWSADGQFLLCPNAMNAGLPTVRILPRNDGNDATCRDMAGFRKAVACIRANPRYVMRSGRRMPATLMAVGSRDRSLSVWAVPGDFRPVVIFDKLFSQSLLDVAWCGRVLAACSRDGGVRLCVFTEEELGSWCTEAEMSAHFERHYGVPFHPLSASAAVGVKKRGRSGADDSIPRFTLDEDGSDPKKRKFTHAELERLTARRTLTEPSHAATAALPSAKAKKAKPQRESGVVKMRTREGWDAPVWVIQYQGEQGLNSVYLKRNLYTPVANPAEAGLLCVEVKQTETKATITAYNGEAPATTAPKWSIHLDKTISRLAANQHWTVVLTHDGHLNAYSTPTGASHLSLLVDSRDDWKRGARPLGLQEELLKLEGHHCMVIARNGLIRAWDLQTQSNCSKPITLLELLTHEADGGEGHIIIEAGFMLMNKEGAPRVQIVTGHSGMRVRHLSPEPGSAAGRWTTSRLNSKPESN